VSTHSARICIYDQMLMSYQISAGGPVKQQLRLVITLERIPQIPQLPPTLEIGLDDRILALHCTAPDWIELEFNDVAGEDDDPRVVLEAAGFDDDLQGMWRRVCLYTQ
jgi:hypothetical protein